MGKPLEEEMLQKYLAKRFTGTRIYTHVRLGKLPDRAAGSGPALEGASLDLLELSFLPNP